MNRFRRNGSAPRWFLAAAATAAVVLAGAQSGSVLDQWHGRGTPRPVLANSASAATAVMNAEPTPASAARAGAPAGEAATPATADTITIQNFAYSPATVTVKAGTTLTWTNKDADPHTVTSMNGGPLRSQPLNTGDTYRYTFTTPGRFEYLCTIHPFMTATVVVTQ